MLFLFIVEVQDPDVYEPARFVIGVSTVLDAYMPKNLRRAEEQIETNKRIAAESASFLTDLHCIRQDLWKLHELEGPPKPRNPQEHSGIE